MPLRILPCVDPDADERRGGRFRSRRFRFAAGGKQKTEQGKTNADVDTSTKGITSNDALQIQLYLLRKIATLNPNG